MFAIPIIFILISIAFFVSTYKKANIHYISSILAAAANVFIIFSPLIMFVGIKEEAIKIDPKIIDYLTIVSINSIINMILFYRFFIHDDKTMELIYNEAIKREIKREEIEKYIFFYYSNKQFKNGFENLISKLIQKEKFKKLKKPKEPKKSVAENIDMLFNKNNPNLA